MLQTADILDMGLTLLYIEIVHGNVTYGRVLI
jgi:hypothetical protein